MIKSGSSCVLYISICLITLFVSQGSQRLSTRQSRLGSVNFLCTKNTPNLLAVSFTCFSVLSRFKFLPFVAYWQLLKHAWNARVLAGYGYAYRLNTTRGSLYSSDSGVSEGSLDDLDTAHSQWTRRRGRNAGGGMIKPPVERLVALWRSCIGRCHVCRNERRLRRMHVKKLVVFSLFSSVLILTFQLSFKPISTE